MCERNEQWQLTAIMTYVTCVTSGHGLPEVSSVPGCLSGLGYCGKSVAADLYVVPGLAVAAAMLKIYWN
jgi:tetrahydromethanopterin S-methyltransferase subunit D